jgi:peptidyl-tRNA hydrolase
MVACMLTVGRIMKMYILIKDSIPEGFAMLAAAHASLAAYLKFQHTTEVTTWLTGPFYKVVCKVNDKEFETAKTFSDHVVLTESALDHQEVAIAFKPRDEWPKPFRFYKLYR